MNSRVGWILAAAAPWAFLATAQTPKAPVSYGKEVAPILKAHCLSCHSGKSAAANLDLTTRAAMFEGGLSGTAIVAGKPEASLLLRRIHGVGGGSRMPLGFPPVPKDQVAVLERWIREGAVFDNQKRATHWAYVAPVRPAVPIVGAGVARNPIDAFIQSKLPEVGLKQNEPADKATLLRRVSLDLIGLPPTQAELDAFLADSRPDAYNRQVERLLASPHYGERQARIWLDLSRYADSDGFEKDLNRTAFKYRDWLIEAFNSNLPYDQMVRQQMAGDLLPGASLSTRIATGFHRNTMHNREGGVDQEEAHHNVILDRVDTTATVFLGSTLACARCHDHKYDPFSQKDYYRFAAFFGNTKVIPVGPKEISEEKWFEPEIAAPNPAQAARKQDLNRILRELETRVKTEPAAKKEWTQRKAEMGRLDAEIPTARVLEELPAKGPLTYVVRHRGEFMSKTDTVTAAPPHFLPSFKPGERADRLALARWMVRRDNPLTARVQVNRMWEAIFGHGIVATPEDFGTRAKPPKHRELLDWLAVELMDRKWDLKAIQRLIVTSWTYQQSSVATPKKLAKDPENLYLARGPRFRMEAEMIRDTVLTVSGLLNRKVGGPSVYPVQPAGIWDTPYNGESWRTSADREQYRRGMYTFWKRTSPYPSFMAFDATSREACTVLRMRTNTPLQALAQLNDPVVMDASRALGVRMRTVSGSVPDRLGWGFRAATGRKPTGAEVKILTKLHDSVRNRYRDKVPAGLGRTADEAAFTLVGNVLLNLDETITKG